METMLSRPVLVEDRLLILDLLHRYGWGYDEGELDILSDCFTEDCIFYCNIAGQPEMGPFVGRTKIMKWLTDIMAQQSDQRRHSIKNSVFSTINEKSANVASYVTVSAVKDGVLNIMATGWYKDELVKEDGIWRIKVRRHQLDLPF